MRILFLTRRFYPEIGGVEKHVLEISKVLLRQGHEVSVITENTLSNYHSRYQSDTYSINSKQPVKSIQTKTIETNKIHIHRLKVTKNNWLKKFEIWRNLWELRALIKDADIVHCHDVYYWYLPFRFLFPGKKNYVTFHGHETVFPPTLKSKIVRKLSEKLSLGNICVGSYISKWYGTKPNFITYGGIEKTQNLKLKNKNFSKPQKKLNVLLIGRLEEDNGLNIYIKALQLLKNNSISYNFVACGDGTFSKKLKKYGAVKGFVNDMNKYIERADFILTSSYLSILEAISRGKKVFSVYHNSLKKDYLLMSPFVEYISISSDAKTLQKEIVSYLSNPNKSYNIRKQALKWAQTQTWDKVVEEYKKLWTI